AAGTFELTGISGASTFGLFPNFPSSFAVFNGEMMFAGFGASGGNPGLWVTNGAAAGTFELTGIGGVSAFGLEPFNLTVFNGNVLVEGEDAATKIGLWVTNGTAAGTFELTGITGASTQGLNASDLTVFNGEVLFNGEDASNKFGLWVT